MSPPPKGVIDHVRHQQARQKIHTERDKLLKRADKNIDLDPFMPRTSKDRAKAIIVTLGLLGSGITAFAVMLYMWFWVYHKSFSMTVVVFVLLIIVSAFCCVGSRKDMLGKERRWMFWVGALNGQAAFFGLLLGFFLYFRYLAYWWKLEEMRTYTNVAAAQDAAAFSDASMFLFTEDTQIDHMRAVGYKSKWTGERYCVAPIVDSSMNVGTDIYYWAVGVGCCLERAAFHCDDAADFSTRSAMVQLEPEDVVRPFMQWAVRGTDYNHFLEAIQLQEASYSTRAAKSPKLVRWTRDPVKMKDAYYNDAKSLATTAGLIYGFGLIVACYFISWRLIPQQKKESVIRHTA